MVSIFVPMALCNLLYMTLHVTTGGSFPKPLTPKQERECLQKIKEGDEEARNTLIVHNSRVYKWSVFSYYVWISHLVAIA